MYFILKSGMAIRRGKLSHEFRYSDLLFVLWVRGVKYFHKFE